MQSEYAKNLNQHAPPLLEMMVSVSRVSGTRQPGAAAFGKRWASRTLWPKRIDIFVMNGDHRAGTMGISLRCSESR